MIVMTQSGCGRRSNSVVAHTVLDPLPFCYSGNIDACSGGVQQSGLIQPQLFGVWSDSSKPRDSRNIRHSIYVSQSVLDQSTEDAVPFKGISIAELGTDTGNPGEML